MCMINVNRSLFISIHIHEIIELYNNYSNINDDVTRWYNLNKLRHKFYNSILKELLMNLKWIDNIINFSIRFTSSMSNI